MISIEVKVALIPSGSFEERPALDCVHVLPAKARQPSSRRERRRRHLHRIGWSQRAVRTWRAAADAG